MEHHRLSDLLARREQSGRPYLEFQRSSLLSSGLYVLAAGAVDRQQPHTEDEIYYVAAGRGRIAVGDEEALVGPGDVVFVGAGVPHHFHDITEELRLVVVFGPPEGSLAQPAD